jgi:UDP-N-acetylglucosamine--N-acetylmuramyl-(pentapeptide) pyrophosphoryl-undecaprenol N-acetylglucosamine transferase
VKQFNIIISGGGTGGHIFPAISIALGLKKRFPYSNILFVGAVNKMEMEIVPKYNFKIKGLWINGFQRSFSYKNLVFPLKVIISLIQSILIIKKFKPDIVIGTGGFASGPLLITSQFLKIPNVIQEQNSFPGFTNRILSKKAKIVFVAYEGMEKYFNNKRLMLFGNPIRKFDENKKSNRSDLKRNLNLNIEKKLIFVLGGSLGSEKINEFLRDRLDFFRKNNFQILWQTGKKYFNDFKKFSDEDVKVFPFVQGINKIFEISDIIVSRSGAITLSELCFSKTPVFLIPSPNVTDNHQYYNALAFERKNAAILIKENELEKKFEKQFIDLINDVNKQKNMIKNLNKMAKPDSVDLIINEIVKLI